jgi:hypothetical protein
MARKVGLTTGSNRDEWTQPRAQNHVKGGQGVEVQQSGGSLNEQRRAEAIGKLMADDRRETPGTGSGWGEPMVGLMRPTNVMVASIIRAVSCRSTNNTFFPRSLPLFLTGAFGFSRFGPCQHGILRSR